MPNQFGIPDISVDEVARRRASDDAPILLDVREAIELQSADLGDGVTHVPMSAIVARQLAALPDTVRDDQAAEIVVFCHHGGRSAQVAAWLRSQGWQNVLNMDGGIDLYAVRVDPTIGRY